MASRANDAPKDTALKVKTYGAPMGYQAPINTDRPSAAPAKPAAVKAAMASDTGATAPAKKPVPRYVQDMPLASPTNRPTGIGGEAKNKTVMSQVDKMQK